MKFDVNFKSVHNGLHRLPLRRDQINFEANLANVIFTERLPVARVTCFFKFPVVTRFLNYLRST